MWDVVRDRSSMLLGVLYITRIEISHFSVRTIEWIETEVDMEITTLLNTWSFKFTFSEASLYENFQNGYE
jgi:hypothetical protein